MKRFSKAQVFLTIVLSFLLVCPLGCKKEGPQAKEIKIGILTPLTGDVASWGEMQKRATKLALERINASGDIRGKKVKVIYEDSQATPSVGVNAFKKLVEIDRVPIVVGSPASNVTLAIAPIANQKKVILLSSGSTATAVGKAGPYIFRIMPSDEVQSSIMADWAVELGYKKVAIIYEENAWGRGLMEAFMMYFKSKGGNITCTEAANPGTTDFRTPLSKIKTAAPEAIYAPLYTRGAGLMIKQAREIGLNQQILGADVYGTPELIEAGGSAVEGVLYTTFGKYDGEEYQKFEKLYQERYGIEPETYATYCYDTFMIAVEALRTLEGKTAIDGESLRQALLSISDFRGVTGLTNFDGTTNAKGKTFDKMTIKNGIHTPK